MGLFRLSEGYYILLFFLLFFAIKFGGITNKKFAIVAEKTIAICENTYADFENAIAFKESSNRWKIVNKSGYIGLFQFGQSAINAVGLKITVAEFKENPHVFPPTAQRQAFKRLVNINAKILNKYIKQYAGKTIHGCYISTSGLIAAAHLAGAGNVIKFIKFGYNPSDGHTRLTDYINKFKNYNIN